MKFDQAVMKLAGTPGFYDTLPQCARIDKEAKVLIFERNGYWFLFNFHHERSCAGYSFEALPGEYETVLSSDMPEFNGFGNTEFPRHYWTVKNPYGTKLNVYLPCRTALVLKRVTQ